jgi:hypothetical protein
MEHACQCRAAEDYTSMENRMKIINQEQDFMHIRESYQHLGEYSLADVHFYLS